jgi:hypothetical protein
VFVAPCGISVAVWKPKKICVSAEPADVELAERGVKE